MRRLALAAALVAFLALPSAPALAQFYGPVPAPAEDYGPGITVSGAGYAPLGHRDRATARAVGDARRRAEGIASTLGVSLGEARAAELNSPFDPRPECLHSHTRRCAPLEAVSAVVTFAIAGGAATDEGARKVEGTGSAFARLQIERKTSPAIRRVFRATRLAVTPDAAKAARANAEAAGAATGIGLGQLFSVVEPSTSAFGYDPSLGAFGPGQFCGTFRRSIGRRDPDTGRFRIVRRVRVRRCYKPSAAVRLNITYVGS